MNTNEVQESKEMNMEEKNQEGARFFRTMALPTLIYSILFPVFLYDNTRGITLPFFVISTLIYAFFGMKQVGVDRKKDTKWYALVMILLGISDVLTGNAIIVAINNVAIFLMLICMLLHNYCNDSRWTLGNYMISMLQACFGTIESLGDPFLDSASFQKESKKNGHKESKLLYILFGIAAAVPLLSIIIALLYSADAVFASLIRQFFQEWSVADMFGVLMMFFLAIFGAYCGLRYLGKGKIQEERKNHRTKEPVIAITVLILISIVYLLFSVIQIVYLFLGKMQLPSGYNYAEYAREGFFQLLFVCMINVALVLFVQAIFRQHAAVKVLLTIISACTYIMLASSAVRMIMYIMNYNLTFLRIIVLWALAVIAILLIGIMIQVYREDFPLFRYCLVVVSIGYLILSFGRTDYVIAKYNLAHMKATDVTAEQNGVSIPGSDYDYLTQLSSDAAPAIAGESGEWVDNYVRHIAATTREGIRTYNISDGYARRLLREQIDTVERRVEIEVRNYTNGEISGVSLAYNIDHSANGTIREAAADGSILSYPSLVNEEGVIREAQQEETYVCTLDYKDLAKGDSSQDWKNREVMGNVELLIEFTDETGYLRTCVMPDMTMKYGETYSYSLTGDSQTGYEIYYDEIVN